jgi:hypothetical protein
LYQSNHTEKAGSGQQTTTGLAPANIVPSSVTLHLNNPDSMSGLFYGGGADGTGKVEVVLWDAVFDGSNMFNHMAQLAGRVFNQLVIP